MRYIKVLLLVLLFCLVMLFFVDNQQAFTSKFPLTLDLRVIPAFTTASPVPCYFLMLAAFLLGALCTLVMLIWDRISLSARIGMLKMRASGFEKDLNRARKSQGESENKNKELTERIEALTTEIETLKASLKDAEDRAAAAVSSEKA